MQYCVEMQVVPLVKLSFSIKKKVVLFKKNDEFDMRLEMTNWVGSMLLSNH